MRVFETDDRLIEQAQTPLGQSVPNQADTGFVLFADAALPFFLGWFVDFDLIAAFLAGGLAGTVGMRQNLDRALVTLLCLADADAAGGRE